MRPLDPEFEQRGHRIKILKRTTGRNPDVALCSRISLHAYQPKKHWEVVLIQTQSAGVSIIGGAEVEREAKELYPSDQQWGGSGWTYQTYQRAIDKFEELSKKAKKSPKKGGATRS